MVNKELVLEYINSGLACCVYQMTEEDLEYLASINADAYLSAIEELECDK